MSFTTEAELTSSLFTEVIESKLELLSKYHLFVSEELEGLFGVPDLVVTAFGESDVDLKVQRIISFELKLTKWKKAIKQAYKYKSFSAMSFVVLDFAHSIPAQSNIDMFINSNIGLILVEMDGICRLRHLPFVEKPYSYALSNKAEQLIMERLTDELSKAQSYLKDDKGSTLPKNSFLDIVKEVSLS